MKNNTLVMLCIVVIMSYLGVGEGFALARQPLKALVVICDDYRSAENNEIAPSVRVDKLHVTRFLEKLRQQNIVQPQVIILEGEGASATNVVKTLQSLPVNRDDILLFYFSGHGGRDKQGKTTLWFTDENEMHRSTLQQMVRAKQARFSLLITDACTESLDNIGGIRSFAGKAAPLSDEDFARCYRHLLLEYRGLLHWSSSSEGEFSFGGGNGGIFTESLFRDTLSKKPLDGWDKIFAQVKKLTAYKFDRMMQMDNYKSQKKSPKKSILNLFADILSPGDKAYEMTQESQTPKAFSMPVPLGISTTAPPPGEETAAEEVAAEEETGPAAVTIYNETEKTITFFLDLNAGSTQSGWQKVKSRKYTLEAGGEVTLRQAEPIEVFYDTGKGQTDWVELESGEYGFYEEEGEIFLDYAAAEEEDTQEDSGSGWEKKDDAPLTWERMGNR